MKLLVKFIHNNHAIFPAPRGAGGEFIADKLMDCIDPFIPNRIAHLKCQRVESDLSIAHYWEILEEKTA